MDLETGRLLLFSPFLVILFLYSVIKWGAKKFRFYVTDFYALAIGLAPGMYFIVNQNNFLAKLRPYPSAIIFPYLILFPLTVMLLYKCSKIAENTDNQITKFISCLLGALTGYFLLYFCIAYAYQ